MTKVPCLLNLYKHTQDLHNSSESFLNKKYVTESSDYCLKHELIFSAEVSEDTHKRCEDFIVCLLEKDSSYHMQDF